MGDDYECGRCHDSKRVIRHYGMGVDKLEPCPACTLEGMNIHPDDLRAGPYEGMDVQEARYAAGEPKPLLRRVKEFLGLRPTHDPDHGGDDE